MVKHLNYMIWSLCFEPLYVLIKMPKGAVLFCHVLTNIFHIVYVLKFEVQF